MTRSTTTAMAGASGKTPSGIAGIVRPMFHAMAAGIAIAGFAAPASNVHANTPVGAEPIRVAAKSTAKRSAAPRAAAPTAPSRASAPVVTVSGTGPEQEGYIHYFVITGPDGEAESHVGIELPGDRIAWSFPYLGVSVSPFIKAGAVNAGGKSYEVEHLYGLRPFPDERSMRVLQQELWPRVTPWLDDKTPYCDEERSTTKLCVSCLGFVLRVLYPGAGALLPALPADFKSAQRNLYTTEDLLLYLAGVPVDGPPQPRLKRIESVDVPPEMREELARIAGEIDARAIAAAKQNPPAAAGAKPPQAPATVDLPKPVLPRRRS